MRMRNTFSLRLQYLLTESGHEGSEELYNHLERGAADVRHHGPGAGHGERAGSIRSGDKNHFRKTLVTLPT